MVPTRIYTLCIKNRTLDILLEFALICHKAIDQDVILI